MKIHEKHEERLRNPVYHNDLLKAAIKIHEVTQDMRDRPDEALRLVSQYVQAELVRDAGPCEGCGALCYTPCYGCGGCEAPYK